jgi:hypothetical protein
VTCPSPPTTDLYTIRAISQDEFEDVKVPATPRELTPKKK